MPHTDRLLERESDSPNTPPDRTEPDGRPDPTRTSRRRTRRLLVGVLVPAAVVAAGLVAWSASRGTTVPYSDPSAKGVIGLCDRDGNPVDHGKVTDRPFAWGAVSSVAAPADYAIDGRTATLFGYQPREGLEPSEWGGQMLTASSRYEDPEHPRAQATDGDDRLSDFLGVFPVSWDGFVQLRLYIGGPGLQQLTQTYATTDIQVTGDSWQVIGDAASVPCDGRAISIEDIYLEGP